MKVEKIEFGNPERRDGWFTVDTTGNPNLMCDLNKFPYPFKTSSASKVQSFHLIEHLENPLEFVLEMWRILRNGGCLFLKVPYGNTTQKNPFHKHDFLPEWFKMFERSSSPYANKIIGEMYKVKVKVLSGKFRFWKPYEIQVKMVAIK